MKHFKKFLMILSVTFFQLVNIGPALCHDCEQCRAEVGASVHGSTGKWLNQNVPHRDWECEAVEDLGSAAQKCEMCEVEDIRYVHIMNHENYRNLSVGCICAGHMEGDETAAIERDKQLRSRAQRRGNWLNLDWKISKKNNPYLKTRKNNNDSINHIVTITKGKFGNFSATIDGEFLNNWYPTIKEAKLAAFDYLWPARIDNN